MHACMQSHARSFITNKHTQYTHTIHTGTHARACTIDTPTYSINDKLCVCLCIDANNEHRTSDVGLFRLIALVVKALRKTIDLTLQCLFCFIKNMLF